MPSASITGFRSWIGGDPLNSNAWATSGINTIACGGGDSNYVGGIRIRLPASASSITVSGRPWSATSFYAGTLKACIRSSEISRPTPSNVSANDTCYISSTSSTISFTFSGNYSSGTYYIYITHDDDTAYCAMLTSSASATYVAGSTSTGYRGYIYVDNDLVYSKSGFTSWNDFRNYSDYYDYYNDDRYELVDTITTGPYYAYFETVQTTTYYYYRCYDLTNG